MAAPTLLIQVLLLAEFYNNFVYALHREDAAPTASPRLGRLQAPSLIATDALGASKKTSLRGEAKASNGVGKVQPELAASHSSSSSSSSLSALSWNAASEPVKHHYSIIPHSYVHANASSFVDLHRVAESTKFASAATGSSRDKAATVSADAIAASARSTAQSEGEALAVAVATAAAASRSSDSTLASSNLSSESSASRASQDALSSQGQGQTQVQAQAQGLGQAQAQAQAQAGQASQQAHSTVTETLEVGSRQTSASKVAATQEATRKASGAHALSSATGRPCERPHFHYPPSDFSSFLGSVATTVQHHLQGLGVLEPAQLPCPCTGRELDDDESPTGRELVYIVKCIIAGCVALVTLFCVLLWQTRYKGQSIDVVSYVPVAGYILPGPMHVVQDLDHLVLMLLWVAGCGTCITMTVNIIRGKGFICETLGLLTLLPVLRVVSFCVCSYDDRLFTKRQEVQRKKEEIQGLYGEMLEDLEKRLAQASESNAGMVEQSFSSKKRDFVRFLDWLCDLDLPSSGTIAMKAFVVQWLVIFQETSVEPGTKPRVGGTPTFLEIMDCTDAEFPSATPILMEELKKENVRFIEAEQDKVQQQKAKQKKRKDIDEKRKSCVSPWQKEMMGQESTWFQPDNSDQIGLEGGDIELAMIREHEGPFPFKAFLGCCRVTIFNKSHLTILLGVVATPILCVCFIIDTIMRKEVGVDAEHVTSQFGLFAVFCCCMLVLRDFERIDAVMQLETEIEELEQDRQKLVQQRVGVGAFFGNTQTLVDFWLYRTIPLLDLMHELHERIKDDYPGSPEQILLEIGSAVSSLKEIRHRIDAPEAWLMTISEDALCNTSGGGDSPSKSPGGSFGDANSPKNGSPYSAFSTWVKAQKKGGHDLTTLVDGLDHNLEKLEVDFLRYAADSESDDEGEGRPHTIIAAARRSVFSPPTVAGESGGLGRRSIHAVTTQPKQPVAGVSFDAPASPQPPKFQGKR